jgi:hypothetical protein
MSRRARTDHGTRDVVRQSLAGAGGRSGHGGATGRAAGLRRAG